MQTPRPNRYRDVWTGQVDAGRADQEARVSGWVHRRRDHGGLIFIDLRDRSGLLQLVFHPELAPAAHAEAHKLRAEDVITATGTVRRRDAANVNPNLATGEIELAVAALEILADAETPPFPLDEDVPVNEELRLRHRSLDLRRGSMQEALALRHRVMQTMRTVLNPRDFLEIETPFLTRSTPEGARDFLVPARIIGSRPPSFYALPQSPAAVQAAADGRRPRALLPDRALLPRRGLARRPDGRVHPARHRDGLRRGGRRDSSSASR